MVETNKWGNGNDGRAMRGERIPTCPPECVEEALHEQRVVVTAAELAWGRPLSEEDRLFYCQRPHLVPAAAKSRARQILEGQMKGVA